MGLKKAKALPDSANARPRVSLIPLLREIKAKATTKPIVMQGIAISLSVSPSASSTTFNLMRKKSIVSTAASKIAVPHCKAMKREFGVVCKVFDIIKAKYILNLPKFQKDCGASERNNC